MPDDDDLPLPPSATDAKAMRQQAARIRKEAREAEQFWKTVLGDPVGRREIWRLLGEAHTFEDRFACGPNGFPQPEATWFQAGEKAFGMRLYQSLILKDREAVFRMHDEHDSRFAKKR